MIESSQTKSLSKIYILDTNVLLHDAQALTYFSAPHTQIIIPLYVLEELDGFKGELSERGQRARSVTRRLDQLRSTGSLIRGVSLEGGGVLKITETEHIPTPRERWIQSLHYDQLILCCALDQQHSELNSELNAAKAEETTATHQVILVTKDANLRVRADAQGVYAIDYEPEYVPSSGRPIDHTSSNAHEDEDSTQYRRVWISLDAIQKKSRSPKTSKGLQEMMLQEMIERGGEVCHFLNEDATPCTHTLSSNEPLSLSILYPNTKDAHVAADLNEPLLDEPLLDEPALDESVLNTPLPEHSSQLITLTPNMRQWLVPSSTPAWGLSPINDEQRLALHYLREPSISLVTLTGKAGTGKTLITLAAGLAQVIEEERYERVLVSRAIFPLGKDIGYLPGTIEEKMEPWLQPIYDNLDFLLGQRAQRQPHRRRAQSAELLEMGYVEIEPITYIRGRSIPRQFLLIDEAQNLTAHEVKTMLTRAGEGTKVVLIGDPHQVDHPYLDPLQNGLSYVAQRFKGQPCAAHVTLSKGERSTLAELAADLL